MAQIDKVRLPDGRIVRPTEWSSTPLYSLVSINTGAITPLQAFSYGIGNTVPGSVGPRKSTLQDTNMRGPGAILPENEELLLYSIMVEFFQRNSGATFYTNNDSGVADPPEVSALNMARIQRDTLLVLNIADTKNYLAHPVGFFPQGMGICTTTAAVDNAAGGPMLGGMNGSPNTYDRRDLATPHRVAPGEAFKITLTFPLGSISGLDFGDDTDARIDARIYADGFRMRPVA